MRRLLVVLYHLVAHTLQTNYMVCGMTLIQTLHRTNPLHLQALRLVIRNHLNPLVLLRILWTKWVD